ncbi:DUF2283 domain-containing protein [Aurantimonas sp. 22II-16-19i]|uniref:DUF2283 domain-containing protein n=1 Tax=Aurantimonas sp. 22II-16-19i TaxID=1317114 RepID=UPI0009F7DE4E|nr:DUF2283 domain-containing protein [Aurantimonas sp. 22II-16-19i]ORE90240.1 hypothetical protein ATO4_21702 [Aurantimonas sp. 22II-16-19i]
MIDTTYDPDADAVYFRIGRGKILESEETGPFITDFDAEGRVIGIEVLSASKVLAPGDWQTARLPRRRDVDAAE